MNTDLFPEKEVEDFKVKPWSLEMVEELAPCLERITVLLIKKGITLDNVEQKIGQASLAVLPEVKTVLSITLREDIEKVKKLPLNTIIALLLTVVTQNITYLKNSFSLISNLVKDITKKA